MGTIFQWLGYVVSFIALLLVIFDYPVEMNYVGILMMVAIGIGIIGGILGEMNKTMILALCFSLLSVAVYFYVSKDILFTICLFTSVGITLFSAVVNKRSSKDDNLKTKN